MPRGGCRWSMSTKRSTAAARKTSVTNVQGFPDITTPASLRSAHQTAWRLGISREQLKTMINRGEGPPFVMIGSQRFFRVETLDKWLAARERKSLAVLRKNKAMVAKFQGTAKVKSKCERRSPASKSVCAGANCKQA